MLLPSHPASRIADPLSLVDADSELDDGLVPFWRFLNAVLEPLLSRDGEDVAVISKLRDVLENISYSRGLGGSPDLSILFSFATGSQSRPGLLSPWLVQEIVKHALQMETLFPDGMLPVLQTNTATREGSIQASSQILTQSQITCLLCHMIIGTLSPPPWLLSWTAPNLGPVWFNAPTGGNDEIKKNYVRVLLSYLHEILQQLGTEQLPVTYRLLDMDGPNSVSMTELYITLCNAVSRQPDAINIIPFKVIIVDEEDDDNENCFARTNQDYICQLVSSNKEVGFGPTG